MRMRQHIITLMVLVCSMLLFSHPAIAQFSQQGPKLVGTDAVGRSYQGSSVSLSADGNTAIIGGVNDNSAAGAAWVWTRSGGVWTQQGTKLVGSGAVGLASQGSSVSLSADGNTAIVGGFSDHSYVGAAWVWTRSGGVWIQQGTKLVGSGGVGGSDQGWSVALSADGNTAIVGGWADNTVAGAAWVWTRSGGVWTQQGTKLVGSGAAPYSGQGISVALSADGNTAIVGGSQTSGGAADGAAWVWTRSGGVWIQQGTKLVGLGTVGRAAQGNSVSLSADGNTAIVGGHLDNSEVGAAWVFAAAEAPIGTLDHFTITDPNNNPIGDQTVNSPFSIKIIAKDANGNTITGWSGWVLLNTNYGAISPTTAYLVNGTVTINNVTLDTPGNNIKIQVTGGGKAGATNYIVVTGGTASVSSLSGTVRNGSGLRMAGVNVTLKGGGQGSIAPVTTDSRGNYQFVNLQSGEYTVQAFDGEVDCQSCGKSEAVSKVISGNVTLNLLIPGSACNPQALTPILLVPGIMGSSIGGGGPYPILPRTAPKWDEFIHYTESWGLHDPGRWAGWLNLIDEIKSVNPDDYKMGCTIFPVPYDWRMDLDDAAREYLKPWIERAKQAAGTTKVHVIAHSMGGLVTRAYIQSDDYGSRNDIDKFAMVGTPNHGAEPVYYMWEGGDPGMADTESVLHSSLSAGMKSWLFSFYKNTSNLLYLTTYKIPPVPISSIYHMQMYDLLHDHVPSAEQLLPTFSFLIPNGGLECNKNGWLDDLNNSGRTDRMGKEDDATGKVRTKIFAGNNTSTLNNIAVGLRWCNSPMFYKDGPPLSALLTGETTSGDGTVLTSSASLGSLIDYTSTTGSHASLIDTYKLDLVQYVTGIRPSFAMQKTAMAAAASLTNDLSVSVNGRVQLYVIDPAGKKTGINPITDLREDEITDAEISMNVDSGNITIHNAMDGVYTVSIKGVHAEDYSISIGYLDAALTTTKDFIGFNHATVVTFTITLNSGSAEKIIINKTPLPPTGLQADAVNSSGLKTRLTWTANADAGVTGYNVYAKYIDEPYLAQIGTTAGTVFDTGDNWAENSSIVTSIYAVSAKKADGTESFLSNMVQNDDRDHDGLTDEQEASLGTNLSNPDSDGDGLKDGEEYVRGTNPLFTDTDTDSYADLLETQVNSDPNDLNSVPSIRIAGTPPAYKATLQTASDAVKANDTIEMVATNLVGDLNYTKGFSIKLKGGFDKQYNSNVSATTILGTLTISSGTITVDRIVIQ